jgi:hypothetical protein
MGNTNDHSRREEIEMNAAIETVTVSETATVTAEDVRDLRDMLAASTKVTHTL